MTRFGIFMSILVMAAATVSAQPQKAAPASGFDADACAKHCQEMAAGKQKMMAEHKAMMDKHDAAMKEIHAKLDEAKTAKGDKKTAALQSAIEQLISLHEGMMQKMGEGMMMHHGEHHPMGEMHGAMEGGKSCCADHGHMSGSND